MSIFTDIAAYTVISIAENFQKFFYDAPDDVTFKYKGLDGVIKTKTVPNVSKLTADLKVNAVSETGLAAQLNKYYDKDSIDEQLKLMTNKPLFFRDIGTTNNVIIKSYDETKPITRLMDGYTFVFKPSVVNTGVSTIKVDELAGRPMFFNKLPLPEGFLLPTGIYMVVYNGTEDNFEIYILSNGVEKPTYAYSNKKFVDVAGQATFQFVHSPGQDILVHYNGNLLTDIEGSRDYRSNNDNTITLINSDGTDRPVLLADDVVEFRAWLDVTLIDTVTNEDLEILTAEMTKLKEEVSETIAAGAASMDMGVL